MILKLELKLEPCPGRGGGLNTWMFKTAAHLARHGVSQAEAKQFISAQAGNSARHGEVDRQVEQGYAAATGEEPVRIESGEFIITKKPRTPQWPDRDDAQIREVVETRRASIEDIIKASPLHPDTTRHPVDVLAELHNAQGDELLCMAPRPASGFCTLTFNKWAAGIRRRLAAGKPSQTQNWEMVVPNLMNAPTGTTKEGRRYRPRTSENACDPDQMRFVVVEVDVSHDDPICSTLNATPQGICASVILAKLDLAQVRMIVQSGGKSLHAWVDTEGKTAAEVQTFFRELTPLGVDHRGRLPEQQFRLPNGYRAEKQARQNLIFWNPRP